MTLNPSIVTWFVLKSQRRPWGAQPLPNAGAAERGRATGTNGGLEGDARPCQGNALDTVRVSISILV